MTSLANYPRQRKRHTIMKSLRDFVSIVIFVLAVVVGAFLLNTFVFQSYNVHGASMQPTLTTNDRLIVNKLPVTWAGIQNKQYLPDRGEIIVFENPSSGPGGQERHLVKRVVGLPGERVVVENGQLTVYNNEYPDGFNPTDLFPEDNSGPNAPTSGTIDILIPDNEIFVAGDNRIGNNSLDSRNGLGTVPLEAVEGPVKTRVFPFDSFQMF